MRVSGTGFCACGSFEPGSSVMEAGAGLLCDVPEAGSTACKTLVHSEVDSLMR